MTTFVRTLEIEHEVGAAGSVGLRFADAEINLRAHDDPTARVRITYEIDAASDADADEVLERMRPEVTQEAGRLDVNEAPRILERGLGTLARLIGRGASIDEMAVDAWIPREAELEVGAVSADLVAEGFRGVQRYTTVSGDVVLKDLAGDVRLNAVSGDVTLRADEALDLSATTVSGDLSILAPSLTGLRINTVSGDIDLETRLAADGDHRIETVSGDLSLGLVGGVAVEIRGLSSELSASLPHRAEGSRDRRRYVFGDGTATLRFSSMSGDVSVAAPRRLAPDPAPVPPAAQAPGTDDERLAILRALERGELDVDEAARRLAGG